MNAWLSCGSDQQVEVVKGNKIVGMSYLVERKGAINLLVSDVLGNGNLPSLVIASDHHRSADAAFLLAQWPRNRMQ